MMHMAAPPTRTEQTYAAMRADVLAGRLRPGDKLPFAELGQRYEASQGVLREGLARLVAEGLVVAEPQFGFRVMALSIGDLDDLTSARCEIEGVVLRHSIEHGDLAWEASVVAAHHRLERTPVEGPDAPDTINEQWSQAHADYHRALLDGCPNQRLRSIAMSLRDSAEVYRRWSVSLAHHDRDVAAEHQRLLDAVLVRDADEAVAALTDHLRMTQALLLTDDELPTAPATGRGPR
jgi:DNA-binding GntR family transcriptional regulator